MRICKKLYYGESAKKQNKELLKNIKRKNWQFGVYVIALSENENNLLDVYETVWFEQKFYGKKKIEVVGIAFGREEAMNLVKDIIDEVYKRTGGFNVREFFLKNKE